MAQSSGFFNALREGEILDRQYNANHYSDNLAVVISNGVLRSTGDDLKVTANGMYLTVAAGRAWINGHYYKNDSPYTFAGIVAPVGGSRIDRVMLRLNLNISERKITLVYVEGVAGNSPVAPAPIRNDEIYDLVLADVGVTANAANVSITDQRANKNLCGWVYSTSGDNSFFESLDNSFYDWFNGAKDTLSSVTLFKKYKWRTVLEASTNTVQFNIPQFDEETCFIEVYVNGILDTEGVEYERNGNVLSGLGLPLIAGTEVEVNCYKSIDGTGIMSVADEITELQNKVDALDGASKYVYKCTGTNDNISLSQIAQAFISGTYTAATVTAGARDFLAHFNLNEVKDNAQITIEVEGKCGVTTAYAGDGGEASRYRYFSLGTDAKNARKLVFDFAKCEGVYINTFSANSSSIVFYGADMHIKHLRCVCSSSAANANIQMFADPFYKGDILVEDSDLTIICNGNAIIAENGTFNDCNTLTRSVYGNAYCFNGRNLGLIRVNNGSHLSYCGNSANTSAVFNTAAAQTNAVISAFNVSCPTAAITGYTQKYLVRALAGQTVINGVISTLTGNGTFYTITNKITYSKH